VHHQRRTSLLQCVRGRSPYTGEVAAGTLVSTGDTLPHSSYVHPAGNCVHHRVSLGAYMHERQDSTTKGIRLLADQDDRSDQALSDARTGQNHSLVGPVSPVYRWCEVPNAHTPVLSVWEHSGAPAQRAF
jgi:hypothetical protein